MEEKILTISEVAYLEGVNRGSVYSWISTKKLAAKRVRKSANPNSPQWEIKEEDYLRFSAVRKAYVEAREQMKNLK